MALTDAQKIDVVRWSGYAVAGIYAVGMAGQTTAYQDIINNLDALDSSQEEALTTKFLTPLETLEAALLAAGDNLDTKIAGPWEANPNEIAQRSGLYDRYRREMCAFLGHAPGPALGSGASGVFLQRC
jgi:hypothetical protein